MNKITNTKTVLSGAIASLGLLILAASPSFANTHTQTKIPATASSSTSKATLAQAQRPPTPAQTTPQQPNEMGCSCCQNMMNNKMRDMMNMPGMTEPNRAR